MSRFIFIIFHLFKKYLLKCGALSMLRRNGQEPCSHRAYIFGDVRVRRPQVIKNMSFEADDTTAGKDPDTNVGGPEVQTQCSH